MRKLASVCILFFALSVGLPAYAVTYLPSAARTVSGTAVLPGSFQDVQSAVFQLTVSAAATESGDTLDVYIQHSVDGTTWDDFVHFTQVLGNGGAKIFLANWLRNLVSTTPQAAPADATMAAGVKQGQVGNTWRIKWVIVDVSTDNASFTFKVDADLSRR